MITKQQAVQLGAGQIREDIHCETGRPCSCTIGPRGGVKMQIASVRVSGRCKTWATRPNEFRLPVKFGLYDSLAITHENAEYFHLASQCFELEKLQTLQNRAG